MTEFHRQKVISQVWVIQTAFLGDCVLSLPFLYRLFERLPHAQVRLFVTPQTRGIFELAFERGLAHARDRVEIVSFDKKGVHRSWTSLWSFVSNQKRSLTPDKVFCLQRSFRSAMMAWLSGSETRVGFSTGSAAFLYSHNVARDWHGGRHEIEKNLDLLRALFPDEVPAWDPREAPSLLAPKADELLAPEADERMESDSPPVSIALGSPWPTKRWPTENVADLVRRLTGAGEQVCLLGDPTSVHLGNEVEQQAPSFLLKNLVGKTNLRSWVNQLAASRVLVANDSAAVHVASDLKVPVVALFGPTLSEFGFAPFRPGSKVLAYSDLECRPCGIHGPKSCPLGHHRCLKDLKAQQVQEILRHWVPGLASN